MMATALRIADIDLEVVQKDVKNVHLSVHERRSDMSRRST